jgi:hypothetical protein
MEWERLGARLLGGSRNRSWILVQPQIRLLALRVSDMLGQCPVQRGFIVSLQFG